MFDDETSRARRPRLITSLVVAAALALGGMSAVALGQTDTTPTDTETTTTETTTTPAAPTIPEGFDEEDCEITEQPDGSSQVTCQREESSTETTETSSAAGTAETDTAETEVTVVPVGGTGAGAGGTAGEDGSAMPILIGIGGLLMAFAAAALARRRRFG
jgi:cytoskeletal protein RodZ